MLDEHLPDVRNSFLAPEGQHLFGGDGNSLSERRDRSIPYLGMYPFQVLSMSATNVPSISVFTCWPHASAIKLT